MKKLTTFLAGAFLSAFLLSCEKNSNLIVRENEAEKIPLLVMEERLDLPPLASIQYLDRLPNFLKTLGMVPPDISPYKATLGRVLFYDKNLSLDRTVSCASCHKPEKAFSDDVPLSVGIAGRHTLRNSPPLGNVANFAAHYSAIKDKRPMLFWDMRAASVSEQARQTLANELEMGLTMPEVVQRVRDQPYYEYLWEETYGDFDVRENQVLECLQEFVNAIGSGKSKLDKALISSSGNLTGDTTIINLYTGATTTVINSLLNFSESELRGRDIFIENCSKCHSPLRPLQEVFEACNGLDLDYKDQGLGALTGLPSDNGVFKAPSLRNIALTAPYMHDGRFKTLEEVVNFYSDEVKNHPNLHPKMLHANGDPNLHLTALQKEDLVAFLHTLTNTEDNSTLLFTDPFR